MKNWKWILLDDVAMNNRTRRTPASWELTIRRIGICYMNGWLVDPNIILVVKLKPMQRCDYKLCFMVNKKPVRTQGAFDQDSEINEYNNFHGWILYSWFVISNIFITEIYTEKGRFLRIFRWNFLKHAFANFFAQYKLSVKLNQFPTKWLGWKYSAQGTVDEIDVTIEYHSILICIVPNLVHHHRKLSIIE